MAQSDDQVLETRSSQQQGGGQTKISMHTMQAMGQCPLPNRENFDIPLAELLERKIVWLQPRPQRQ